jgi:predicted CXXCH cytochrome family protein
MKLGKSQYINIVFMMAAASLLWTCTPKFSQNVKNFIFDGVPDNENVEVVELNDSILTLNEDTDSLNNMRIIVRNEFNLHEPYRERDCSGCHDKNNMSKPKLPVPGLCNLCHDDYNEAFNTLHGPVASGDCLQCHDPHKSKLDNLLLLDKQDLCLHCHNSDRIYANTIHEEQENTSCTTCHDPHGGKNNYFLTARSCYNCHDDFEKEYKNLHGPVASSDCSQCHASHTNSEPNLLMITGDNLCYKCHEEKEISNQDYHSDLNQNSCLDCHDPHGGNKDKFFLKEINK